MPSEVRFAEIRKLLESHGWTLDRIRGSHHNFQKEGERPITLPVHKGKVKPGYAKDVRKRLGLDR